MEDVADAEFVFHEEGGIERDLVPIGEGVAGLDADRPFLGPAAKVFDRILDGETEAVREANLDFLSEPVIRPIKHERIALINESCENSTGRQHVSLGQIRETAPRKTWRSAIGTWHFIADDGNSLGGDS